MVKYNSKWTVVKSLQLHCTGYSTSTEVSLWVDHRWWHIANASLNISLCLFNLTVPPQSNCFSPILYIKESITKALKLLFTAVHGSPFWLCNHIILTCFIIKQAVILSVRTCKQYQYTVPLIFEDVLHNFKTSILKIVC